MPETEQAQQQESKFLFPEGPYSHMDSMEFNAWKEASGMRSLTRILPSIIGINAGLSLYSGMRGVYPLSIFEAAASIGAATAGGYVLHELMEKRVLKANAAVPEPEKRKGSTIQHIRYRGKDMEVGDVTVHRGDNIAYVTIPYLLGVQRDVSFQQRQTADYKLREKIMGENMYTSTIQAAAQYLENHSDARIVAVEIPDAALVDGDSKKEKVPLKKLLANKGNMVSVNSGKHQPNPEKRNALLFTRDEYLDMAMTKKDAFLELLQESGDPVAGELWKMIQGYGEYDVNGYPVNNGLNPDDQKVLHLLKKHFTTVLKRELDTHFNGPDVGRTRDAHSYAPGRERVYSSMQLRKTDHTGTYYAQFSNMKDGVYDRTVERMLGVEQLSLREVLVMNSRLKTAQVAYFMLKMLEDHPEDLGIWVASKPVFEQPLFSEYVHEGGTQAKQFNNPMRIGVSALAGLILSFAAANAAHTFERTSPGQKVDIATERIVNSAFQQIREHIPWKASSGQSSDKSEIGYYSEGGGGPDHSLDWKIDGNMDPTGYYFEYTSHQFADGSWQYDTTIAKDITSLPQNIEDKNQPYLQLSRDLVVKKDNPVIKIPLREGMHLSALNISLLNSDTVGYYVVQFDDGTVGIQITDISNDTASVSINAYLTETNQPEVRATHPIDPIHLTKLSPNLAQKTLNIKANSPDPVNFFRSLAEEVSGEHTYSFYADIIQQQKLQSARTPEQVVETIADYKQSLCNTSATENVLLSTVGQTSTAFENVAVGYAVGIPNPGSGPQTAYLRNEDSHMFPVTNVGTIFDPTATKIDPSFHPQPISTDTENQEWDAQHNQFIQKATSQTNGANVHNNVTSNAQTGSNSSFDSVGGNKVHIDKQKTKKEIEKDAEIAASVGATLGGGFFAARQLRRLFRRRVPKEEIHKDEPPKRSDKMAIRNEQYREATEQDILSAYSDRDMEKTYQFFMSLFWGKNTAVSSRLNSGGKQELLKKIRDNVNFDKLDEYIVRPQQFENARLSPQEKAAFRTLALYLLS